MNPIRSFLIKLMLGKKRCKDVDALERQGVTLDDLYGLFKKIVSLEKQGVSFTQLSSLIEDCNEVINSEDLLNFSYSQFAQDLVLRLCYFFNQRSGFYVDIGANHPYSLSNTCYFYKRGWSGINIEPNPDFVESLKKERQRDININCAVASQDGTMDFYLCETKYNCLSTLSKERAEELAKKGVNWTKKHIDVLKLSTIFNRYLSEGKVVDFMNVDCEGYDIEVLKSNDWDKYRPRFLVVEDLDNIDTPLVQYCKSINYDMVSWFGYTKFFKDMNRVSDNV
jgi:FkbM family methyltransferase